MSRKSFLKASGILLICGLFASVLWAGGIVGPFMQVESGKGATIDQAEAAATAAAVNAAIADCQARGGTLTQAFLNVGLSGICPNGEFEATATLIYSCRLSC